jgi:hypothetical protein
MSILDKIKTSLTVGLLAGAIVGSGYLYIGFSENNQGEYFDTYTKKVDFPYALETFLIASAPVALLSFAVLFIFLSSQRKK